MATEITKKPTLKVTSLGAPVRQSNTRTMKATWKVPSELIKSSSKSRATSLEIDWILDIPGKNDPKKVTTTGNEKLNNSQINLNSLKIGNTTYTRSSFYPIHASRKLYGVTVKVIPKNKKGKGGAATATRKFAVPRAPVIANLSFNPDNGHVTTVITTDPGNDYRERYDTSYSVYVKNTRTGRAYYDQVKSSTATSISVAFDASGYQDLEYDEYIYVRVAAVARGYAGNSPAVSKEFYVSYPSQATIESVRVSERDSTGKVTIGIRTNSTKEHPVDSVKLEYLANVTYEKASDIPFEARPTESNIIDDAECTALSIPVTELVPDRGKYTWIRVKSYHAAENVLIRYSEYRRLEDLETPAATAADDDITIISAKAGSDGESAVVTLGWNKDGQDDSTGTELTWSDEEDTWKSTKNPDQYTFTWSDGPITDGEDTYQDSATIVIKDIAEATKYYIKARRYLEDETTTYSKYSNTATVLTSEKPETVVASCDRYVPTGNPLSVYWTFSGNSLQTEWRIVERIAEEDSGQFVYTDGAIIAEGRGSVGSAQISAERLTTFAKNNETVFNVQISTGSDFVESENHCVTIIEAPVITASIAPTLTAQPAGFDVSVSTLCDLVVIVSSQGASGQFPEGFRRQTAGDTIHSDVYSPVWEWDDLSGMWTAAINLTGGLDFWDKGTYTLEVTAIDRTTGLHSQAVTATFDVQWAYQAPDPDSYITVTPIDEYDEEGFHRMAAEIALTPPENAAATDQYDIYRLTGDGPVLIGEGFPLTHTAYDEYAPFGAEGVDLAYRVAIRTIDGDVEFADIPYQYRNETLRFDWTGGFLELPYNLSVADTYKKDVDIRQHMDGSVDGYWNPNITRTGKLCTDLVKLMQQEDVERARELARYTGPVFVRTPEGTAYEADVQITDMSADNKTMMTMAADVTEVGLTQEFILPIPYVLEDEEGDE